MARNDASGLIIIEDMFDVIAVDGAEGKKFDKVSRIECNSKKRGLKLVIDINVDLYPIQKGESYTIALASNINIELGSVKIPDGYWDPTVQQRMTLMDNYEYVMFGRVYGCSTAEGSTSVEPKVYVSYGGLLMSLSGPANDLRGITYGQQLYFLMKRNPRG
eukprot:PhF_6_TR24325/c0_g1_i1/m.33757/K03016/RPB8, POLR2H; DNA-directed RNA polymerases I, II, and III subunit RPABC3